MSRQFFARLMLALAADMVFCAALGHGIETYLFAIFSGAWAGAGGRDNDRPTDPDVYGDGGVA